MYVKIIQAVDAAIRAHPQQPKKETKINSKRVMMIPVASTSRSAENLTIVISNKNWWPYQSVNGLTIICILSRVFWFLIRSRKPSACRVGSQDFA